MKRRRGSEDGELSAQDVQAAISASLDDVASRDAASAALSASAAAPPPPPAADAARLPVVSVIIPVHNTREYLPECFESIARQTYGGPIEISVYDDASDDATRQVLAELLSRAARGGRLTVASGPGWRDNAPLERIADGVRPAGSGFGRNEAVRQSSGTYLCLLDSDDIMEDRRIERQLAAAAEQPDALVGCRFRRIPDDSTWFYTKWANELSARDLVLQQYREITLIQPTWFMHRQVFDAVGGWPDTRGASHHIPEDLHFFHAHMACSGQLVRVDDVLLVYRHRPASACAAIPRRTLLRHKLGIVERRLLSRWERFMIWGAGRDGRNVYNELSDECRSKVAAFVDIDPKKLGTYHNARLRVSVPVLPIEKVQPPFLVCVAMGRSGGELEANIAARGFVEGVHYWHFS